MSRAKDKTPGMTLLCPCCGSLEATITLDLNTLGLTCEECEDSFSAEVARDQIADALARWNKVVELVAHIGQESDRHLYDEAAGKPRVSIEAEWVPAAATA